MTSKEEYGGATPQWEVDQRTTPEDLEETLDEMKRLFHKGEYHEMPAPIQRGRQQVQALMNQRDSDEDRADGLTGTVRPEFLKGTQPEIEAAIREVATETYSPLPDGSHADPEDWDVEYWLIEDNSVHFRVTHPDYPFSSEVKEFEV